ncbi:MAG: lipoate--protein ligase family protein [Planctomycetaceae bacterium]|nr:lipoate--protein ligase family protein [Planctomycetaceae bacterium]
MSESQANQEQRDISCELIIQPTPQCGEENMWIDERLLELALTEGRCFARIYSWSEPTVTLGYFQKDGSGLVGSFSGLPSVRRLSGGGAILHDQELTYSVALPPHHDLSRRPSEIYARIHRGIIQLLSDCGCSARLRGDSENEPAPHFVAEHSASEPFLCFMRHDPNDIVCDSPAGVVKLVGSAQRRRRGAVLQHGSILLQRSKAAVEIPGITDLFPEFNLVEFRQALPGIIAGHVAANVEISKNPQYASPASRG